jgi:sugar phosphate isomerase/epimerase
MKFGVKTFDNPLLLKHFEEKADFFEIMAIRGKDYSFLKDFFLPIVIHAEHQRFEVNPADSTKHEQNLKSITFAIELANLVNAKKIIVHPGVIEKGNKNCSLKNSINFFKEINDDRILIENLPKKEEGILKGNSLCGTFWSARRFLIKTGKGFCFDINHSLIGIKNFKGNYKFIKKYLKLKPSHYHIGGQKINPSDTHLYFKDSELDLKKILNYFPEDAEITLETGTDEKLIEEDLKIIKKAEE